MRYLRNNFQKNMYILVLSQDKKNVWRLAGYMVKNRQSSFASFKRLESNAKN